MIATVVAAAAALTISNHCRVQQAYATRHAADT